MRGGIEYGCGGVLSKGGARLCGGGGGRDSFEIFGWVGGGQVCGGRALLRGGLLDGLEGWVADGLVRLLLATIGGVEPIIARVGGDNLGGGVVPEEFAGLDGGQACREVVLLPWEVIPGFGGRVEGKIRGFVPVTIGGPWPIKAGGVGVGLEARFRDLSGSTSTGMLRSMLRVVCLSFLGGFW